MSLDHDLSNPCLLVVICKALHGSERCSRSYSLRDLAQCNFERLKRPALMTLFLFAKQWSLSDQVGRQQSFSSNNVTFDATPRRGRTPAPASIIYVLCSILEFDRLVHGLPQATSDSFSMQKHMIRRTAKKVCYWQFQYLLNLLVSMGTPLSCVVNTFAQLGSVSVRMDLLQRPLRGAL